jgi:chromosome segregation ATPase
MRTVTATDQEFGMKIYNEQVHIQNVEEQKARKNQEAPNTFGDMLTREMKGSKAGKAGTLPPPGGSAAMSAMLHAEHASRISQTSNVGSKVMENVENVLAKWEDYAHQLEHRGEDLRGAHQTLESIAEDVKQLKSDLPEGGDEGLRSLVDELEILTVTERFKFNRGDYIA